MFTVTRFSRRTQRFVCMALSALIVSASLSLGAVGAEALTRTNYSVTITQLQ